MDVVIYYPALFYAQVKELTDEKKKEAEALENKVANTSCVRVQRKELLAVVEEVIL